VQQTHKDVIVHFAFQCLNRMNRIENQKIKRLNLSSLLSTFLTPHTYSEARGESVFRVSINFLLPSLAEGGNRCRNILHHCHRRSKEMAKRCRMFRKMRKELAKHLTIFLEVLSECPKGSQSVANEVQNTQSITKGSSILSHSCRKTIC
jgi:hypothetical protein